MRIALLSHCASPAAPTGAERSMLLLARGLRERGHDARIVLPGPWALDTQADALEVPRVRVPCRAVWLTSYRVHPGLRSLGRALRDLRPGPDRSRLASWLRDFAPDVVHVNCLPHLRGAAAAASLGLPVVWHLREILAPGARRRWLASHLRRHGTHLVAVSHAVARWLSDEGLEDMTEVVWNGVTPPPELEEQAAARQALGLPETGCFAGLFGQLVPHKGALDFLAAGEAALAARPALHLVLAGDGPAPYLAKVRAAIERSASRERIHLLPPQAGPWRLMAAANLVCLATTTPDPLPRAIMEAMSVGRPIVTYDSGGAAEMVEDGVTGAVVPLGDTDALGGALARFAGDAELRARCAAAGRERALAEFSLEGHVSRMEALLGAAAGLR